jgi:hypothetical protein
MYVWWRDVVNESTYQGHHTVAVQIGLRWGMILFIVSEVMFFFAFFWAFFNASLAPGIEIGGVWPPHGIQALNPWEVPLVNTLILLTSGASVTWAHHAILAGWRPSYLVSNFDCSIGSCIYCTAGSRVFGSTILNFRWRVWINFLSRYWIPWFSRICRYNLSNCMFVSFVSISFYT